MATTRAKAKTKVDPEPEVASSGTNFREEFKVTSSQIVEKVKELIKEGNIRRILIKQKGKTVLEIPMTIAAVGVLFAPVLAAIGAFAALATECTIEVERRK